MDYFHASSVDYLYYLLLFRILIIQNNQNANGNFSIVCV